MNPLVTLASAVVSKLPGHRRSDQRLDRLGSATPGPPANDLDAALLQARNATEANPIPDLFDLDALRLVDVPDQDDLMARAKALRWNRDLIDAAIARETNAPARRTIRERNGIVVEWAFVAPSACRWCDLDERDHGRRFGWLVGDHDYTAPSNRMRLSRMQGRRAASVKASAL